MGLGIDFGFHDTASVGLIICGVVLQVAQIPGSRPQHAVVGGRSSQNRIPLRICLHGGMRQIPGRDPDMRLLGQVWPNQHPILRGCYQGYILGIQSIQVTVIQQWGRRFISVSGGLYLQADKQPFPFLFGCVGLLSVFVEWFPGEINSSVLVGVGITRMLLTLPTGWLPYHKSSTLNILGGYYVDLSVGLVQVGLQWWVQPEETAHQIIVFAAIIVLGGLQVVDV